MPPRTVPLFRTAIRKEKRLTQTALTTNDVYRMIKRRMRDVGLPPELSSHSLRVAGITDLLSQGVPMEDGGRGTMERKRTLRGSGREFDTIAGCL